jgi:hypothetical protein
LKYGFAQINLDDWMRARQRRARRHDAEIDHPGEFFL